MRARYPDAEGFIERDGVKVGYEVFGAGEPAVVFAPTDPIVNSRAWKAQVPYLAREFKIVTIDPRGNGRSDRPQAADAYADPEFAADIIAVLDAAGIDRAVLVGMCSSSWWVFLTAGLHPGRVLGVVSIASWVPYLTPPLPWRVPHPFDAVPETDEGWAKDTRHYWLRDWRGFAEFFFGELLPEPHSTKQHEDCVGWVMQTSAEVNLRFRDAPLSSSCREDSEAMLARVHCPVLAIHGVDDRCQPWQRGERVAALTGGELLLLEGAGHLSFAREPVVVNRAIRDFAARFRPAPATPVRRTWTRPVNRPKRVLYVSSPIGLGHARRDLAIADELRKLRPGLEVHWLAQHPVTELLGRRGELIHPASAFLASESAHFESEAAEHDLHAFQAVRNMDEILISNFMVFADLTEQEPFDLWIGDEAWDIDYFLHENPELKRSAYAWMTDFVGWLPMPDGGAAFPAARRLVPGLRMIVVTGPRIDPESLAAASRPDGLDVRGYVHDLHQHLAACDLAVVQDGLTTTMELTASQRPFIYIPLRHHFEQNFHVRHRLAQYGAGRCLDYDQTAPEVLAQAIADEIARPVSYRPVETDGAARAAASLAELI